MRRYSIHRSLALRASRKLHARTHTHQLQSVLSCRRCRSHHSPPRRRFVRGDAQVHQRQLHQSQRIVLVASIEDAVLAQAAGQAPHGRYGDRRFASRYVLYPLSGATAVARNHAGVVAGGALPRNHHLVGGFGCRGRVLRLVALRRRRRKFSLFAQQRRFAPARTRGKVPRSLSRGSRKNSGSGSQRAAGRNHRHGVIVVVASACAVRRRLRRHYRRFGRFDLQDRLRRNPAAAAGRRAARRSTAAIVVAASSFFWCADAGEAFSRLFDGTDGV
mmetsp:Transcript_16170/g.33213  ORF Transcript_16170/g.33213 Transcript_16170/m.33213 type:complete len:274 (+) Transcript_16170:1150-1971(+)